MSALNALSKAASAGQTRIACHKRRWLHKSSKRSAILMPAMSPLMTEGTIARWKKKEGDSFAVGDVLLQIQSDLYVVDVQAQRPGIMGKILMPDGTPNVPVEQVIALVAQDVNELVRLQIPCSPAAVQASPTTNLTSTASPISSVPLPPPQIAKQAESSLSTSTPALSVRRPSLFEMHTMGYGQRSLYAGAASPKALGPTPHPSQVIKF